MPSLSEFRQQYPQYDNVSDSDLADALYKKYYSNMPREQYNQRIGLGGGEPQGPPDERPFLERATSKIGSFLKNVYENPPPTIAGIAKNIREAPQAATELTYGADPEAAREAAGTMLGAATIPITGSRALQFPVRGAAPAAPAAEAAAGAAAPAGAMAAGPGGRVTEQQIAEAAQRLSEGGSPVQIPQAIATENLLKQQTGAALRHTPIIGDPIVKNTERAIQQLGTRLEEVAQAQGGQTMEGGGRRAGESILDYIGPRSQAKLDEAYNAVDAAINPSVLRFPQATADMAAQIAERRRAAALPESSPALRLVERAIADPETAQLAKLTEQYGPELAQQIVQKLGPAAESAGLGYHGTKDLRSYIGRLQKQSILPEGMDKAELAQIYGALTEDLGQIAGKAGGTTGRALWEQANKTARDIAQQRTQLADIVGQKGDASPAEIFGKIRAAASGTTRADTELLTRAKQVIGDDWDNIVSSITGRLGRTDQGMGPFKPETFLHDWNKISPSSKELLYGQGAHRQALDDIATISSRWPQLQKFMNPSGTARTGFGISLITHPLTALASLLDPTVVGGLAVSAYTARRLAAPVRVKVTPNEVLSKPATAASAARWMRAYQNAATNRTAAAQAQLNLATRNLLNNVNSEFGDDRKPQRYSDEDFQRDVQNALNGPGWEKIQGSPEARRAQTFYPDIPINRAAWEQALAGMPESRNIEDRRK